MRQNDRPYLDPYQRKHHHHDDEKIADIMNEDFKSANVYQDQEDVANALFELGMDFDVIKNVSGVDATDLLLAKAGLLKFDELNLDSNNDLQDNIQEKENSSSYQESRLKGTNKRDSNPNKNVK